MDISKTTVGNFQSEIRRRIDDFIEYEALVSPTEFANKAGIDPSGLIKMLKGQMKITLATLRKISDAYRVNISWLVTGEGEMFMKNDISNEGPQDTVPEIGYKDGSPYYDVDFECGFDELMHPGAPNPECLIRMPGYEKATMWCNATGRSMEPEISNGDIIALQWIEDPSFLPFGNVYAIITTNGLRTIKRLGRSEIPGNYNLVPTNPEYDEQDIPADKIYRVYRVMGSMKSF